MKKIITAVALSGFMLSLGACIHKSATHQKETKPMKKKQGKYFCTMNPEVTSDQPGVCPKCGMELVEREK